MSWIAGRELARWADFALKSAGVDESAAKAAISFLINENQVEMTENRKVTGLELVA